MRWSKGRSKLGFLDPFLGIWQAQGKSEMGPVKCKREFREVLSGKYIQLIAR